jgi:hypothetical protein
MEKKQKNISKGRARYYYYKRVGNKDIKLPTIKHLLEAYKENPQATFIVIIKYTGDKIIDGVRVREKELTFKDIIALEK